MKKRKVLSFLLVLTLVFSLGAPLVSAVSATTTTQQVVETEEGIRPQDDYFSATNALWLSQNEIPASSVSVSVMGQAQQAINNLLRADYDALLAAGGSTGDVRMDEFLEYYSMAFDFATLDAQGAQPLYDVFERIDAIEDVADLSDKSADLFLDAISPLLNFGVTYDPYDNTQYALITQMPNLLMGSKEEYELEPLGEEDSLRLFRNTVLSLLNYAGVEGAEQIVEEAFAFDAILVPLSYTQEEQMALMVDESLLIKESVADFAARSNNVDFTAILTELAGGQTPADLYVIHSRFFDQVDAVINDDTLPLIKSWMKAACVLSFASYMDEEMQVLRQIPNMGIYGQTAPSPRDEVAFSIVDGLFSEWNGYNYGRNHFTDEMRAKANEMVDKVLATYWERLWENDWLSPETRDMAIHKLASMGRNVGYNETVSELFSRVEIQTTEEGGTLLSNTLAVNRLYYEDYFAHLWKPVEEDDPWTTNAHVVNATYNPTTNSFTIPASLFHPLVCSPEASDSWNYGSVGMIIGHEISHAFDNQGANYDADGNLANWWTEEDYAEFESRGQKMVELFDGLPMAGGVVDGSLTLGENIADAGGLACVLQIVEGLEDGNVVETFEAYATLWGSKYTDQYANMLLSLDVHAPAYYRVNAQLFNNDTFHMVYGVQPGDGMYIPPESRVVIW